VAFEVADAWKNMFMYVSFQFLRVFQEYDWNFKRNRVFFFTVRALMAVGFNFFSAFRANMRKTP
jgi:hypothetical protein